MSSFSNLQSLYISNAKLSDSCFEGLSRLKRLNLDLCSFQIFSSESFRHVLNIEFLSISGSTYFFKINFAELNKLEWLVVRELEDYSFLDTLNVNKNLCGLSITSNQRRLDKRRFFKNLSYPNLETLYLNLTDLDTFDSKCLAGLPKIKNFSLSLIDGSHVESVTMKTIDLSSLNYLESICFGNIEFKSLDFIFEKLKNLKWYNFNYL